MRYFVSFFFFLCLLLFAFFVFFFYAFEILIRKDNRDEIDAEFSAASSSARTVARTMANAEPEPEEDSRGEAEEVAILANALFGGGGAVRYVGMGRGDEIYETSAEVLVAIQRNQDELLELRNSLKILREQEGLPEIPEHFDIADEYTVNVSFPYARRNFTVMVKETDTLASFKKKIHAETRIEPRDQTLTLGNDVLYGPNKHLRTLHIIPDCTVTLSIAGVGGGKQGSIRGIGGAKGVKTNVFVKQTIITNKKNALVEMSHTLKNSNISMEEVMAVSGAEMMRIFNLSELNPQAAFSELLGKVSDEAIGTKESSQLLDFFKSNKPDTRIAGIGTIVMRCNYVKLFTMFDEIGGMKETADMTFDYVATNAFTKSVGSWDWSLMKRAIEDEQIGRLAIKAVPVMG